MEPGQIVILPPVDYYDSYNEPRALEGRDFPLKKVGTPDDNEPLAIFGTPLNEQNLFFLVLFVTIAGGLCTYYFFLLPVIRNKNWYINRLEERVEVLLGMVENQENIPAVAPATNVNFTLTLNFPEQSGTPVVAVSTTEAVAQPVAADQPVAVVEAEPVVEQPVAVAEAPVAEAGNDQVGDTNKNENPA